MLPCLEKPEETSNLKISLIHDQPQNRNSRHQIGSLTFLILSLTEDFVQFPIT